MNKLKKRLTICEMGGLELEKRIVLAEMANSDKVWLELLDYVKGIADAKGKLCYHNISLIHLRVGPDEGEDEAWNFFIDMRLQFFCEDYAEYIKESKLTDKDWLLCGRGHGRSSATLAPSFMVPGNYGRFPKTSPSELIDGYGTDCREMAEYGVTVYRALKELNERAGKEIIGLH